LARRLALVLAWLATAVATGLLAAPWFAPPRAEAPERRPEPGTPPETATLDAASAPAPAVEARRVASAEADRAVALASPDEPRSPLAAGWIVATVTQGGEPAESAQVYAVPAGARTPPGGTWGGWPSAPADARGVARIGVPQAGSYDVGVEADASHTMAKDVAVAAGATVPLALRLPRLVDVDVEIQAPGLAIESSFVEAGPDGAPTDLGTFRPARDETCCATSYALAGGKTRLRFPEGARLRLAPQAFGPNSTPVKAAFEPSPAVVVAPARVVFRSAPVAWLRLAPRLLVTGEVAPSTRSSSFWWRWTTGPRADEGKQTLAWNDGRSQVPPFDLPLHPGGGRLAWGGDGVIEGEQAFDGAPAGETREGAIVVRVRADALPHGLDALEVVGGPDPWPEDVFLCAHVTDAGGTTVVDVPAEGARAAAIAPGSVVVLDSPWWTSEPTRLPSGGRARVRLVPAGWLLVVLHEPPSAAVGDLVLRRADGAWLGTRVWEDLEDAGRAAADLEGVGPGSLVGPLPEGDVALVVSLGGVEKRRVTGRVRANRITPLDLRW
jgi:hypothetical protein